MVWCAALAVLHLRVVCVPPSSSATQRELCHQLLPKPCVPFLPCLSFLSLPSSSSLCPPLGMDNSIDTHLSLSVRYQHPCQHRSLGDSALL
ncbi:hypothetical protein BC826DRAFT_1000749 [Russula brevipes]|nr:hypothetical protein BC826DRAFT_1000749 [Russula brevipes]